MKHVGEIFVATLSLSHYDTLHDLSSRCNKLPCSLIYWFTPVIKQVTFCVNSLRYQCVKYNPPTSNTQIITAHNTQVSSCHGWLTLPVTVDWLQLQRLTVMTAQLSLYERCCGSTSFSFYVLENWRFTRDFANTHAQQYFRWLLSGTVSYYVL